ncbi:alpha/beta hydrolase [Paenarthrobacter aromaticivorans]|uniref:Alpha/beta hydrolase n=1 Tax=Paenarthrobacter aromaticivorans TaxID=2849150 RepID=A0ABS6I7T3_9MICC|nr:alpha/beta hydrolase [Paenarthrobacter sp. MMS21-TAE1-1]MBU8867778.1 alpha/beta hydrolase [Paenarthrobacter sp. MMS21-TAE1-1]
MNSQRDGLDQEVRAPLELLLQSLPGGINAITDLAERRRVDAKMVAEMTQEIVAAQTCSTEDLMVERSSDGGLVPVRIYRPENYVKGSAAIFFIHGGGMTLGNLDYEHGLAVKLCEELGILVVSTGYRKAPEHPHPAQLEDCYSSLSWMASNATTLGFDPRRLAVYGGSAGGNLALSTSLKARDMKYPQIAYTMAPYPMVDHRNALPSTFEVTEIGVWDRRTNIEAWSWFLGHQEPDGYAAPLHAVSLTGLPPTFIDVGTHDLFRDEDIALVQRLIAAGVPTELHVYPGAYHAAELFAPEAALSQKIWTTRLRALREALKL